MRRCKKCYLFSQVFADRWAATGAFPESVAQVKTMSILQASTPRNPWAFPRCCRLYPSPKVCPELGRISPPGVALSTPGKEKGKGRVAAKTPLCLRLTGQALTSIQVKLLVHGGRLTEALLHAELGKGYFIQRNQ